MSIIYVKATEDLNTASPVNDYNPFPVKIVPPPGVAAVSVSGDTGAMTGTTATAAIPAPGAGFHLAVSQITATCNHATTGTAITITGLDNGQGGPTTYHLAVAAVTGCVVLTFNPPLPCRDNTALTATNVTTSSNTYVSASATVITSAS